jgi:hypothetical protein
MYNLNAILPFTQNPGIWTVLFISIASLGTYYSIILVARDRVKGRLRSMMGLYTMCISILLFHLLALRHLEGNFQGWVKIPGAAALFLVGPCSYRMMGDRSTAKDVLRVLIPLFPAVLIIGAFLFDLFHDLTVYTLGAVYLGVSLFKQAYSLKRESLDAGLRRWNTWYTVVQAIFYLVITLSCILMSAVLCYQ